MSTRPIMLEQLAAQSVMVILVTLASGVVTFVFSDIEGSTKLWETDPDGMRVSLARHDEIVRGVVEAANGTVFKQTVTGSAFDSVTAGPEATLLATSRLGTP